MLLDAFRQLYWREFDSYAQGAEYFHVEPITVKRWLTGKIDINPMAEKLLIIKSIGFAAPWIPTKQKMKKLRLK